MERSAAGPIWARLAERVRRGKGFAAGLAVGVIMGGAISAWAADVVGRDGYLVGWAVIVDGEVVCEDPYAWTEDKEIECE